MGLLADQKIPSIKLYGCARVASETRVCARDHEARNRTISLRRRIDAAGKLVTVIVSISGFG
jgi:hypothetical protein